MNHKSFFSHGALDVIVPNADLALFGAPATRGTITLPFLAETIEDPDGGARFSPRKEPEDAAPFPRVHELDWILSLAPRHPKGTPASTPASIARRLEAFEADGERIDLTPRHAASGLCIAERIVEAVARVALEAYGLAPTTPDLADAIRSHFSDGATEFAPEEMDIIVERAATDPAGCLYPFDARGLELDAEYEAQRVAGEAARAEQAKRDAEDNAPNMATANELGVMVFAVVRGCYPGRPRFAANEAHYSDSKRDYYLVNAIGGVRVPPQKIGVWPPSTDAMLHEVEVMPGDYVPACSKLVAHEKRVTLTPFDLRPLRDFDRRAMTEAETKSFRDYSTAEGRHAIALGRKLLKPMLPQIYGEALSLMLHRGMDGHWVPFACDLLMRGLRIRSDIARDIVTNLVAEKWDREPAPKHVDLDGLEHVGAKPATPFDDIMWIRATRLSIKGGPMAHVGVDELFTAPDESELEPVGVDPWASILAAACADKSEMRTEEIETILGQALTAKDPGRRVQRIMRALGFEKTRVPLGGGREYRAYVRNAAQSVTP